MPCRDYRDEPDYQLEEMSERLDQVTRIACKAMTLLEELGKEDFLLLEDEELREWWAHHKMMDKLYNKDK